MVSKYKVNAEKVLARMEELKLTQVALAEKSGICIGTIERSLKPGNGIQEKTAEKLAIGLGLTLDVLLGEGYIEERQYKVNPKSLDPVCAEESKQTLVETFSRNLVARQKQLRISRVELSEMTGISQREIFKLANAYVNPKLTTVACIAKALDVSIDDLLTESYVM